MSVEPLIFRVRANKRMFQRRISKDDVRQVSPSCRGGRECGVRGNYCDYRL